ncbi:MAG TPA: hypothetical protein VHW00_22650 [Thermoanaerobaculia bacterium]|nr:hypothetical protein [Thermoanaerobaculia bacterium]
MTTTTEVHEIVRARGASLEHATDDAPLGANGLGLDSIAIAEVLLDCERLFGVPFADLLEGNTITLRTLIERASSSR